MRVCFPCVKNEGMDTVIYGHFGSAPLYLVVDTENGDVSEFPNCDACAPDAGCNPYMAFVTSHVSAVVSAGMGDGFLGMLNAMGIPVFHAQSALVRENLELFSSHGLEELTLVNSAAAGRCGDEADHQCTHDHGGDHGCGHTH
jgi:predicted Fe-Mo cluster-binding NifX family protein